MKSLRPHAPIHRFASTETPDSTLTVVMVPPTAASILWEHRIFVPLLSPSCLALHSVSVVVGCRWCSWSPLSAFFSGRKQAIFLIEYPPLDKGFRTWILIYKPVLASTPGTMDCREEGRTCFVAWEAVASDPYHPNLKGDDELSVLDGVIESESSVLNSGNNGGFSV